MKNLILISFLVFYSLFDLLASDQPDVGCYNIQNVSGSYSFYSGKLNTEFGNNHLWTGGYKGEMVFKNDTLSSGYFRSGFIGLTDSLHNWLWYKSIDGTGHNQINSSLALEDGWLISGVFSDTLFIDDYQLVSQEYQNIFFAFINKQGEFTMAEKKALVPAGGNQLLKKGTEGNLFFAGEFYCDFELNDSVYSAEKNRSVIISKITDHGEFENFRVISSRSSVELADLEVLSGGGFLLGIGYTDSLNLDQYQINPYGEKDFIIVRYDEGLDVISFDTSTGTGNKFLKGLIGHQDGYVIYGEYSGEFIWQGEEMANEPGQHIFLSKSNQADSLIWSNLFLGYSRKNAGGIISGYDDNLYLWADYRGKMVFNDMELQTENFTFQGFVSSFSSAGEFQWIKQAENLENIHPGIFGSNEPGRFSLFGDNRNKIQNVFNQEIRNGVFLIDFLDCDYSRVPTLPTDTFFCGPGILDAGNGYTGYLWNNSFEGRYFEIHESQIVTLQVSDKYGCINHDTIFAEVLPVFEIEIAGNEYFCPGQSVFLTIDADAEILWNTGTTGPNLAVDEEGEYTAYAINPVGCTTESSVFVSTYDLTPPFLSDYYFVSPGEVIELNPGNFQSYLWTGGHQQQVLIINGNDFEQGEYSYALEVVDFNNCNMTHEFVLQVVINSTSSGDYGPGGNFENNLGALGVLMPDSIKNMGQCEFIIYPNPGNGPFYVRPASNDLLAPGVEFNIVTTGSMGNILQNNYYAGQSIPVLEKGILPPGTYFMSIVIDERICNTKKIIITP